MFIQSGADFSHRKGVIPAQVGIHAFLPLHSPKYRRVWLVSGVAVRRLSDRARHRLTNHCLPADSPPDHTARNGSSLRGRRGSSGGPPPPTPAKPSPHVRPNHHPLSQFPPAIFRPCHEQTTVPPPLRPLQSVDLPNLLWSKFIQSVSVLQTDFD